MQEDMHFYGTYAFARAAGIKPEVARTIAYASQFVDGAIEDETIEIEDGKRAVVPTMTAHKVLDYQNAIPGDQWKVWVPFHFLPGNDPNATTFIEKMVCRKDSAPAKQILAYALQYKAEPFGPYLAGITAHVYADTFSHYGFIGLSRRWNKVKNSSIHVQVEKKQPVSKYLKAVFEGYKIRWRGKFETLKTRLAGTFAEIVPVGHGAVGNFPDISYLQWRYQYESGKAVERKNAEDFIEASKLLYTFFCDFVKGNTSHGQPVNPVSWDSMADKVLNILTQEGPVDKRIEQWQKAISSGELFQTMAGDKDISYSEEEWGADSIIEHFKKGGTAANSDACLFIQATWELRNYVLHELLPGIKVIAC